MKGWIIILLFSGVTELRSFDYRPNDYDLSVGIDTDEIVMSCSERAEELREQISEHDWDKGWVLKDGTGTFQGYIC